MTYDHFTVAAQNALKTASKFAKEKKHKAIENGHIIKGLLTIDKDVIPFLLKQFNVKMSAFSEAVDQIIEGYPALSAGKLVVSSHVEKALNYAQEFSQQLADNYISMEHILAGVLHAGDNTSELLAASGMEREQLIQAISKLRRSTTIDTPKASAIASLNLYAVNLNEKIKTGEIDPVIGRTEEIRRVLQILSRRRKNNPLVIGEAGVGKTAVVEGLAQRIVRGDVPENLRNNQIFSLDMAALISGASKQGEFEERLKSVVKEVQNADGQIILFIDEIHLLVGAGRGQSAMDAANILKPALARGELKAIGATTVNEYRKYFEKDKALDRRFQKVMIEEPTINDTVSILRGIKEKYEEHHQVKIKDEAIVAAVELSKRYITERFLPDKAIDLMDEAAAKLRLEMNAVPAEIDEVERQIRQLSMEKEVIKQEDGNEETQEELRDKIANLSDKRSRLRAIWESEKRIIGELVAIKKSIKEFKEQAAEAERNGDYEKAAALKYEQIKQLQAKEKELNLELQEKQSEMVLFKQEVDSDLVAEIVANSTGIPVQRMLQSEKDKLLRIENELSKRLIGQNQAIKAVADAIRRSRTGLADEKRPIGSFIFLGTTGVGKTELAKALAAFLFNNERMITRIDMSEYMEKNSVNRLIGPPPGYVGYDEGGQLTDAVRLQPYSVVLLDEIEKAHPDVFNMFLQVLDDGRLTDNKGRTVNFKNTIIIMTSNAGSAKILDNFTKLTKENKAEVLAKTRHEIMEELKKKMSPEFLNRIDEIIMFSPLSYFEIRQIVELQIKSLKEKLKDNQMTIHLTPAGVSWIARMSYNPQFGARPVKRVIQRQVLNELSKQILTGAVEREKIINIDFANGNLVFTNVSPKELAELKTKKPGDDDLKAPENVETAQEEKTINSAENTVDKKDLWAKIIDFFRQLFSKENKKQ